jgi:hypothetical protein
VAEELDAAEAERDRLAANADAVRSSRADLDAEGEVLHRLAALRTSVVERVRTAEQTADIDALRAALAQTFTAVYLRNDGAIIEWEPRLRVGDPASDPRVPVTAPIPLAKRGTTQQRTFVS